MTDIETALRARIEEWNAHILGPGLTQWGIDDLAFILAAVVQGMVDVRERTIVDAGLVIAEQGREIEGLKDWVGDLQGGLYINCVYCGFRYGPGESTPATLPEAGETLAATALREHVERCPNHPMSRLKKEIERLREALGSLLMELSMCAIAGGQIPHPNEPVMLKARSALRATPEAGG